MSDDLTRRVNEILAGPPPEGAWVASDGQVYNPGDSKGLNPIPNLLVELLVDRDTWKQRLKEAALYVHERGVKP